MQHCLGVGEEDLSQSQGAVGGLLVSALQYPVDVLVALISEDKKGKGGKKGKAGGKVRAHISAHTHTPISPALPHHETRAHAHTPTVVLPSATSHIVWGAFAASCACTAPVLQCHRCGPVQSSDAVAVFA